MPVASPQIEALGVVVVDANRNGRAKSPSPPIQRHHDAHTQLTVSRLCLECWC